MNYLFDAIILGFLVADGTLVIIFALKVLRRSKPKRKFSWAFVFAFIAAFFAWGVVFYGSFVEPARLVVHEQNIKLSESPTQHVRVALVSDMHVGPYKQTEFVRKMVEKIMAQKPDIILLGGDFVYHDEVKGAIKDINYLEPLKALSAPLGVFAVLGNHDYGNGSSGGSSFEEQGQQAKIVATKLKELGVQVLINNDWTLSSPRVAPKNFTLLGINDLWADGSKNIYDAISSLEKTSARPVIILSHNPDIVKFAQEKNVDLVISGHTHGGQIRLPFIGSISAIPDELGRAYDRGLFSFGKTQLFVTSGVGEIGPRARLLAPPEIVVLNLEF